MYETVVPHDKVQLISGIQGWFNIGIWIIVIHNSHNIKEKK